VNDFSPVCVLIDRDVDVNPGWKNMTDYRTVPNPALKKTTVKNQAAPTTPNGHIIPAPRAPLQQRTRQATKAVKGKFPRWLLLLPVAFFALMMLFVGGAMLLIFFSYSNSILPRVQVADIELGGLSQEEAAQELSQNWGSITLSDGRQVSQLNASALGIQLDAQATAAEAFAEGHGEGGFEGFVKKVYIAPVLTVDATTMQAELDRIAPNFMVAPVDAGVHFENGQVSATEPQYGRLVDTAATVRALQGDNSLLADGILELVMVDVAPAVLDSSPILAQAQALLSSPLDIRVFDPVTGDSAYWSVPTQSWANWLTASSDPGSPIGLSLSADPAQVEAYLSQEASAQLDNSRYLEMSDAVESIRSALSAGRPQDVFVTVHHRERSYVVQSGDTITSIAWNFGIPYLYIMDANGGIQDVSVGQTITIPPADIFVTAPVNPNKRIVVSISEQRTRVYENGQVIYDWPSSTGIASSPTWTGVYQIISHEVNAYAANWDLYMPDFMGVYQPVPNSDFTNGFHGFPTRGGGQLLWENSLGTRVTYGCILLSNTNIAILYDWAEEGVVVEIRG
jgi:lipoprotein-anchoring transpeptidase ErfK/SrfK